MGLNISENNGVELPEVENEPMIEAREDTPEGAIERLEKASKAFYSARAQWLYAKDLAARQEAEFKAARSEFWAAHYAAELQLTGKDGKYGA